MHEQMIRIKKALFPVGGLGTRFLPATKSMPKEMLTVIDKPLIQYAVEEARDAGIEEFIFITGRGKSVIEDHFDHSDELNTELQRKDKNHLFRVADQIVTEPGKICYLRQQAPLGLGHAVWCARHLIHEEPFAVILADDLIMSKTPCIKQMMKAYTPGSNMVAFLDIAKEETSKYGILEGTAITDKLWHANTVIEKPSPHETSSTLGIIGRYILDPKIFDRLSTQKKGAGDEIQLTDALASMIPSTPLYGYGFEGQRFDCGSKEGLLAANVTFALHHPDLHISTQHLINTLAHKDRSS